MWSAFDTERDQHPEAIVPVPVLGPGTVGGHVPDRGADLPTAWAAPTSASDCPADRPPQLMTKCPWRSRSAAARWTCEAKPPNQAAERSLYEWSNRPHATSSRTRPVSSSLGRHRVVARGRSDRVSTQWPSPDRPSDGGLVGRGRTQAAPGRRERRDRRPRSQSGSTAPLAGDGRGGLAVEGRRGPRGWRAVTPHG